MYTDSTHPLTFWCSDYLKVAGVGATSPHPLPPPTPYWARSQEHGGPDEDAKLAQGHQIRSQQQEIALRLGSQGNPPEIPTVPAIYEL